MQLGIQDSHPRYRAACRAALVMVTALIAAPAFGQADGTVVDLHSDGLRLDLGIQAVVQNPVGGGASVDLRLVNPGAWMARVKANFAVPLVQSDTGEDIGTDLDYALGFNGPKGQLGFEWMFSSEQKMNKGFRKLVLVNRSGNTELWRGYEYMYPSYQYASVGLDVLLENGGCYEAGLGEDEAVETWYPRAGYDLYLYPHVSWRFEDDYRLIDSDNGDLRERMQAYLSAGALACPDFSQYGVAMEATLSLMLKKMGAQFTMGTMFGFVLRDDVPTGSIIAGREGVAGLFDGFYIPFRLEFGLDFPIGSGTAEADK